MECPMWVEVLRLHVEPGAPQAGFGCLCHHSQEIGQRECGRR